MARLSRLLPAVAFVVSLVLAIRATAKPSEESPVTLVWSDVDFPLGTAISGNFTRTEEEVSHCYEPTLRDDKLNIFNESLSFLSVVSYYYVRPRPGMPCEYSFLISFPFAARLSLQAHLAIQPDQPPGVYSADCGPLHRTSAPVCSQIRLHLPFGQGLRFIASSHSH